MHWNRSMSPSWCHICAKFMMRFNRGWYAATLISQGDAYKHLRQHTCSHILEYTCDDTYTVRLVDFGQFSGSPFSPIRRIPIFGKKFSCKDPLSLPPAKKNPTSCQKLSSKILKILKPIHFHNLYSTQDEYTPVFPHSRTRCASMRTSPSTRGPWWASCATSSSRAVTWPSRMPWPPGSGRSETPAPKTGCFEIGTSRTWAEWIF